MKRTSKVTVGLVLSAGMLFTNTACTSEPDQEFMDAEADHQQVCVKPRENGELERRPDHECSDDGSSGSATCLVCWYFLGRAFGAPPAHGQRFNPGSYGSFIRPSSGTIAKPPASGGFGTTKVSVGG